MACSVKSHHCMDEDDAPKIMSLHLLEEITDYFSREKELGSGKYGTVYEGVQNGVQIAVKMLRFMPGVDEIKQFKREFENLRRLRHRNIVQLLGYCYEIRREYVDSGNGIFVFADRIYRALCFEYMHMGNLRDYISEEFDGLDWQTRYKIIKGMCEGLKYLHQIPIYHLDLKPENILLDKNMTPKLADFGLSRLVGNEQTRGTDSPVGTRGYMPPEYIEENLISDKFDIFSLGVVMIQIMAGQKGYNKKAEMSSEEFIELVQENWRNRLQEKPECTSLKGECNQVKTCIEIASDCVRTDRKQRPEIGTIICLLNETEHMLNKKMVTNLPHQESTSDQIGYTEKMDQSEAPSPLQRMSDRDGYVHMERTQRVIKGAQGTSSTEASCFKRNYMLHRAQLSDTKPGAVSQLQNLQPRGGGEDQRRDASDGACSCSRGGEGGGKNTRMMLPQSTTAQQLQQMQMKVPKLLPELEFIPSEDEDEGSGESDDVDNSDDEDFEDDDDEFYDDYPVAVARLPAGAGARNGLPVHTNGNGDNSTGLKKTHSGGGGAAAAPRVLASGQIPGMAPRQMGTMGPGGASFPGTWQVPGLLPQQVSMMRSNTTGGAGIRGTGQMPPPLSPVPPPPPPPPLPPQVSMMKANVVANAGLPAVPGGMGQMTAIPPRQMNMMMPNITAGGGGMFSMPLPPQQMSMTKPNNVTDSVGLPGTTLQHLGLIKPSMINSAGFSGIPGTGQMDCFPMSHLSMQAAAFNQGGASTPEMLQLQAAAATGNPMAQQQYMALLVQRQQQQQQQLMMMMNNGHAHGHDGVRRRRPFSCVFSFFCCA